MNGVPGKLLEQGIVGLLKCVKILVILQSRWWLVVRIPSILLFVSPPRLLLFLSIDLLQKFMGREKKTEEKKPKTTQVNCDIGPVWTRLTVSAPPPLPTLSPLPKVFIFLVFFFGANQKGCCVWSVGAPALAHCYSFLSNVAGPLHCQASAPAPQTPDYCG